MTPAKDETCSAPYPLGGGFICTLDPGHAGDHEAWGYSGKPYRTWSEAPAASPPSLDAPAEIKLTGQVVPDSSALDAETEIIVDNVLWDYATFLSTPAGSPSYNAASAQYDASRESLCRRVWALVNAARQEGAHIQRELALGDIALTFDELLEYGRRQGVPLYDGYPWSFNYAGYPVTHENNDLYLITTPTATLRFNRGQTLVANASGEIYVR